MIYMQNTCNFFGLKINFKKNFANLKYCGLPGKDYLKYVYYRYFRYVICMIYLLDSYYFLLGVIAFYVHIIYDS